MCNLHSSSNQVKQIFKASKMFPIKFYAKIIKSAQVTRVNLITIRIFSQNDIVKIL